jgi:hypothetical protein
MGKKDAISGESPRDRAMNKMDKFITRNERRNKHKEQLPARIKDQTIPIDLWPLKDQLEYYKNRSPLDCFKDKYPSYSHWLIAVQHKINMYPITFTDFTSKLKPNLLELYATGTSVPAAVSFLQKRGVY